MTFHINSVSGISDLDNIIAGYLGVDTLSSHFMRVAEEEFFERMNSVSERLFHLLASKAKVRFKITGNCGFFTELAESINSIFTGKFKVSRECNCEKNWYKNHSCPTQSDNWGNCNCHYDGGCQKLCNKETFYFTPVNVSFFGRWKVKKL
jgi:hypothetical protein